MNNYIPQNAPLLSSPAVHSGSVSLSASQALMGGTQQHFSTGISTSGRPCWENDVHMGGGAGEGALALATGSLAHGLADV